MVLDFQFYGSHEAAKRSAMLYSMMATCKLHSVNPYTWLKDVIERLPQLKNRCAYLKQEMEDKLIEHKCYIKENGQDMPEIRNWKWDIQAEN